MFKIPGTPSARAEVHELADFVELITWLNGSTSAREVVALLGREGEAYPNEGCDDIDDDNANTLDEVFIELEFRQNACDGRYPFELNATGNVLKFCAEDELTTWLYGYMLLSTRLNMASNKIHAEIDGTKLLEEIASEGLRHYLGLARSQSFVFGTSTAEKDFPGRVTALCKELGEGNMFCNHYEAPLHAKDDKLDVVAWLPFADRKGSRIVIFAQCKTGTAWTEHLCKLQPQSFIKKWIKTPFLYDPVRAYVVSEAVDRRKWFGYAIEGGLFFDRCRMIECCESLSPDLLSRIKKWSAAALDDVRSGWRNDKSTTTLQ